MNIYRKQFYSVCPNNGQVINYQLEIRTQHMIQVEHINTAVALHAKGYHEQIADGLFRHFGGQQTLKAHHHGVDVETLRK